ncbi:MAG: ATP-dependent Clp protease adapter ClpS [Gammaproteobacteria bacterium]|nr:ATP-dependent Clp protease adapter ClpS [Gammaproteobacteria bacterium]
MSDNKPQDDDEPEGAVAIAKGQSQLKRPPMYKVLLLNDDYTPMEFVVEVLEHFFHMERHRATQVMLAVHTEGSGVCGIFSRDVAQTKVMQVNEYAQSHQHPLRCTMESN